MKNISNCVKYVFQGSNWFNVLFRWLPQLQRVNVTKLTHLNYDCMHLIMKQLNLIDLINVAQTSKQLNFVAVDVFKHQYQPSSKTFVFEVLLPRPYLFKKLLFLRNLPKFEVNGNRVEIYDYEMILNFVKIFGHFLKKIDQSRQNPFYPEKYAMPNHYINEYCDESLNHFNFNEYFPIENMRKPFKNVHQIDFIANWQQHKGSHEGHSKFISKEIFPALRRLSLAGVAIESNCSARCFLPNLEHLNFYGGDVDESVIKDFLLVNSHIQSIELSGSLDVLHTITKTLPNLTNITLWHSDISNLAFDFDTVETLWIKNCNQLTYNLSFTNLLEFTMETSGFEHLQSWTQFFTQNSNMTHFNLKFYYWDDEGFEMFASHLQNLEELTLTVILGHRFHSRVINAITVINFLEHNEKLKKLELSLCDCNKAHESTYRQRLSVQWNIGKLENGLSFERKGAV